MYQPLSVHVVIIGLKIRRLKLIYACMHRYICIFVVHIIADVYSVLIVLLFNIHSAAVLFFI